MKLHFGLDEDGNYSAFTDAGHMVVLEKDAMTGAWCVFTNGMFTGITRKKLSDAKSAAQRDMNERI